MIDKNKKFVVRTDLAYDETKAIDEEKIDGVREMKMYIDDIFVIEHHIKEGAEINKLPGIYYTINLDNVNYHDHDTSIKVENALSCIIKQLISHYHLENKNCLVIGLGNESVTPDAIGPYAIDSIIVTRHLPKENVSEGYRKVAALSPGVMGTTGIETFDIVKAVKDFIDVDFVIVVDALCSSSLSRVNRTIQITDTGIAPGSGVGNKRTEISKKTLNVPVFAIGVPTVVDAVSIASDTINYALKYLNAALENNLPKREKLVPGGVKIDYSNLKEPLKDIKEQFMGQVGLLSDDEKQDLFRSVLTPNGFNLIVTSKDIDEEVENLSKIVAWGINKSLHDAVFDYE